MKIVNYFRAGVAAYIVICATFLWAVSYMGSSGTGKTLADIPAVSISDSVMSAL